MQNNIYNIVKVYPKVIAPSYLFIEAYTYIYMDFALAVSFQHNNGPRPLEIKVN